mgnify:CR=1 FL=1
MHSDAASRGGGWWQGCGAAYRVAHEHRVFVLQQRLEALLDAHADDVLAPLGDVAAADNPYHMNRYKHKFLQIQYNINNAPCLKNRILNGDVKASSIVDLSPQGLWPDGPWAAMKEVCVTKDMKREYNSNVLKDPTYKGIFKCGRCKSYKTTYYEMQTLSLIHI